MSVAFLVAGVAWAGACCVGSTSTVPTRLGECERTLVGTAVALEDGAARWDAAGAVHRSSMREQALVVSVAAAHAWSRSGQVGLVLPLRAQRRVAPGVSESATGVGDARLIATWDPVPERHRAAAGWAWPVPVLTTGLRLPTGRDWTEAQAPLLTDVTGLPGGALVAGVAFERTLDRTPWSLGVQEELGRSAGAWTPTTRVLGSVGRYVGRRWSLAATGTHQRTAEAPGARAVRTRAGLRIAVGSPGRWRAWAGAEQDLALGGWGRDNPIGTQVGVGALLVRGGPARPAG